MVTNIGTGGAHRMQRALQSGTSDDDASTPFDTIDTSAQKCQVTQHEDVNVSARIECTNKWFD